MRITPSDDFDKMEEMIKNWCKTAGDGVHYEFIQKGLCKVLTPTDESNPWWQQLDAVFKEQFSKI
jgi:aminoacylase